MSHSRSTAQHRASSSRSRLARTVGVAITVLAVLAIGVITLSPNAETIVLPFWCMRCGARPAVDVLLNVLLFVPLGAGLALLRVRGWTAALAVVLATGVIEALQYAVVPGRFASARDIVTNATGGMAGWYLWHAWRVFVLPSPRAARRLAFTAAGCWMTTQAITAWSTHVVVPAGPLWSQLAMEDPGFPLRFGGKVLSLSVGGVPIHTSERLAESEDVRRQLLAGEPLTAVVTSVAPAAAPAPIALLVADDILSEVTALAQSGTDVYFRVRTRAAVLGFRNPSLRLDDVFRSAAPQDTVTITARFTDGQYRLTAVRGATRLERAVAASPSWMWALLAPIPHFSFGPHVRIFTALWLFVPFAMIAFWSSRRSAGQARDTRRATAMLILATTVMGLGVVPVVFGLPLAHWSEWLAAAAGTVTGWALARLAPTVVADRSAHWTTAAASIGRPLHPRFDER